MLGAQARAAELQAAKSAAMRQKAHRDAQDQAIPPNSTPVSLTDFTRNPLMTKNKGVKAFRPISDSDFEVSTRVVDYQSSNSMSPVADDLGTGLLELVPTGPRAMVTHSGSFHSQMTPSRATAPAFTPQITRQSPFYRISENYDGIISTPPRLSMTTNTIAYVFGPDDLSPIKQEIKFAEIDQKDGNLARTHAGTHRLHTPLMPNTISFPPQDSYAYETHHASQSAHARLHGNSYMSSYPNMYEYQQESGAAPTNSGIDYSQTERYQSFADDLVDHHIRLQQDVRSREIHRTRYGPSLEQPYDRNSKMQSFVAAQQAMARTGKTVLNNPYLQKSSQLTETNKPQLQENLATPDVATISPFRIHSAVLDHGSENEITRPVPRKSMKLEDKEAILRAILKRTTARDNISTGIIPDQKLQEPQIELLRRHTISAVELQSYDNPSSEWWILNTISSKDRDIMLRNCKAVAAESSGLSHSKLMTKPSCIVGTHARDWLETSSSHLPHKRAAIDIVVDEYEKRKDLLTNYGIIGRPVFKEAPDLSSRGTLKAVANIMVSLHDYANDGVSGRNNKYTSTPRYAVDESVVAKKNGSSRFDNLGF